jgi:hypothetical protein
MVPFIIHFIIQIIHHILVHSAFHFFSGYSPKLPESLSQYYLNNFFNPNPNIINLLSDQY